MGSFLAALMYLVLTWNFGLAEAHALGTAARSATGTPIAEERRCTAPIAYPEARLVLHPSELVDAETRRAMLDILDGRAALATEGPCSVAWTDDGHVVVELSGV